MFETDLIVGNIIKKSFPELKKHKIIILNFKRIYGARAVYLYFLSLLIIGKSIGKRGVNQGGIAHELSHLEIFRKWGFWKSALFSFLQFFSGKIRRRIEREADLLAINKGYGKELYLLRKRSLSKSDERIRKLLNKYYLSPEEIKSYMKKQK